MPPIPSKSQVPAPAPVSVATPVDQQHYRKQDPPNAIQVELVEGCSLACTFCGVQGIRTSRGQYQFMTASIADAIVERLSYSMRHHGWNPRIEFAMHGEPSVHPDFVEMVARFGQLNPRELIVVSNGTGFIKDPVRTVKALIEVGVTSICLDQYDGCDYVPRFLKNYQGENLPAPVYEFGHERGNRQGEKFRGPREVPCIVVKNDVSHLVTPYDKVNTHCGAGGPAAWEGGGNPAMHKRCAKPFRELSIRWDGNVSHCCNDFRGVYKVTNVQDQPHLDALWHHERFEAARRMLYHADRDFVPCQWCDAISPRVGLLPDKYGKETVPLPDAHTLTIIDEAIAGDPYTVPVLRGWESQGRVEMCVGPDTLQMVELGVLVPGVQPHDA